MGNGPLPAQLLRHLQQPGLQQDSHGGDQIPLGHPVAAPVAGTGNNEIYVMNSDAPPTDSGFTGRVMLERGDNVLTIILGILVIVGIGLRLTEWCIANVILSTFWVRSDHLNPCVTIVNIHNT